MKVFNVNFQGEKNSIYCECANTRNGFKHIATMYYNRNTYVAVCYYINRTWETFIYQNVIRKLYCIISDELKVKAVEDWKAAKGKKRISTTERERIYKDIDALFKESFKEIEQQPVYSYACNDWMLLGSLYQGATYGTLDLF